MKNVMVTSCSHSHGRPSMRVTMSQVTVTLKPVIATPHRIISTRSSGSSTRHFRCRCDSCTRESTARPGLLDVAHQLQNLDRVRAQLLRQLVLDRLADLLEARLVDAGDDLDADLFEAGARVALHLERLGRLH